MDYHLLTKPLVISIVFSIVGIAILLLSYLVIEKLTPEKSWKEIVQNQNIALAIIFASFILGVSIIIASAIKG
jgi:putative membrane protein